MTRHPTKPGLIVCADDYGASPEVNEAIISLLEAKRISAVSCLVHGKAWQQGLGALKKFQGTIDIGLHLFFEEMPFNKIAALAYTHRLNRKTIWEKFKSQLAFFREGMGIFPDHIDGHQHVHQLPVFKNALMDLLNAPGLNKLYVRNSGGSLQDILSRRVSILKNILIASPGVLFKKDLRANKIPTNNDFLGIYDFNTARNSGEIFEMLLGTVEQTNSILVTHPAYEPMSGKRAFYKKRAEELKYLESSQYLDTLGNNGLQVARFIYPS